jgi:hypothetical protein
VNFKLCLRTNVWVAVAQALVAAPAITVEADRLLSLDLSNLGDGTTVASYQEEPL